MTTHRLSNVDSAARTADCTACGHVSVKVRKTDGSGNITWRCLGRLVTQHFITDIDEEAHTAFCRGCQEVVKIASNPARSKGWVCAVKLRADQRAYRLANPEKIAVSIVAWRAANRSTLRRAHLWRTYQLTPEQFTEMLDAQGGRCLFCLAVRGNARNEVLHVDHDETTGLLRGGLLCDRCNRAMGYADHDPERLRLMAAYLERFRALTEAGITG